MSRNIESSRAITDSFERGAYDAGFTAIDSEVVYEWDVGTDRRRDT